MYCRELRCNNKNAFDYEGPLLIACNHPNSFLDAIIIASLFKRPVYSLARGDVFKNKWVRALLRSLKMLPVYRTSEGVENMEHNYSTFDACKKIFKQNGIVLIFSEGRCINEWHLRPLMKGTARLALSSWSDGIPLKVLPTGINYQSFSAFGKNIHLFFGATFGATDVQQDDGFGKAVANFNSRLQAAMRPLVYEIPDADTRQLQKTMRANIAGWKKMVLALPAIIGVAAHAALYLPAKKIADHKSFDNDHYDSILFAILFVTYPFYLLFAGLLLNWLIGIWGVLFVAVLPFCAWSAMMLKRQF